MKGSTLPIVSCPVCKADVFRGRGELRQQFLRSKCLHLFSTSLQPRLESFFCLQVWTVQPATLVEAERKGAELAQKLAKDGSLRNSGTAEVPLADATNLSNKKTNGHKGTGMYSTTLLTCFVVA